MSGCNLITGDEVQMLCADECEKLINCRMYKNSQRRWDDSEKKRMTYGFIKCVKITSESSAFYPGLYAFLYKCVLANSAVCMCMCVETSVRTGYMR